MAVLLLISSGMLSGQGPGGMRSTADLKVQVRLSDGANPRGVLVRLQAAQMPGGQTMQSADAQGRTNFVSLPQAIYQVIAEFPGYKSAQQTVDLQFSAGSYLILELRSTKEGLSTVPPEGPTASIAANISPEARKKYADGQRQVAKSNPGASIGHFRKAIELDPKYTDAYLALGTACLDTGAFREAQEALNKAVELEPKLPSAHFALGAAYNRTSDLLNAEKHLTEGLRLNDSAAEGHYELARTYLAMRRPDESEAHARRAISLDAKHAPSHIVLGNALLAKRDYPGALHEYREYVKLDPKSPMSADVKDMIGKLEKAAKDGN